MVQNKMQTFLESTGMILYELQKACSQTRYNRHDWTQDAKGMISHNIQQNCVHTRNNRLSLTEDTL